MKPVLQPLFGAIAGALALLVIWHVAAASGRVDPLFLPSPTRVFQTWVELWAAGEMPHDIMATLVRVVSAWTASVVIGVSLGLLLGLNRNWSNAVAGLLHGFRSLPSIALFPLALLLIGVSQYGLIILGSFTSLLMVSLSTLHGVEGANPRRIRQARRLGMGTLRIAGSVLIWESLAHAVSAAKIAAGFVTAVILAGEMYLGAKDGVGHKILVNQEQFRTPATFAFMFSAASIGILLNLAVTGAGAWLLRWQKRKIPL